MCQSGRFDQGNACWTSQCSKISIVIIYLAFADISKLFAPLALRPQEQGQELEQEQEQEQEQELGLGLELVLEQGPLEQGPLEQGP